jgi:hypothetical protein
MTTDPSGIITDVNKQMEATDGALAFAEKAVGRNKD